MKFQYIKGLEFQLSNSSIFQVFQDAYEPCNNSKNIVLYEIQYIGYSNVHFVVWSPLCRETNGHQGSYLGRGERLLSTRLQTAILNNVKWQCIIETSSDILKNNVTVV